MNKPLTKELDTLLKVPQQLHGKHILITGTTGFVGKVLLEKLIRSVPDIGGIHLLIRANKRHGNARSRFIADIASSSVFDTLKAHDSAAFHDFCDQKIFCVSGEITETQFGMERGEFRALAGKLDLIVNCAASVNFREELDKALEINTFSLRNIVDLSEAGGNLPVVQVSTCYVNGFNRGDIAENISTASGLTLQRHKDGYFEINNLLDDLQEKINVIVQGSADDKARREALIEIGIREAQSSGWNDTYTFTKWLGEQLLLKSMRGYSLTLLRPSIVESTLQEPTPGWIEGVKVADSILMAYAREKIMFFPGKRSGIIDIIPADLVANSIILSLAEQCAAPGQLRIYQCCSGSRKALHLGQFIDDIVAEAQENHQHYEKLFKRRPRRPLIALDARVFSLMALILKGIFGGLNRLLKMAGKKHDLKVHRNLNTALELATIYSFYAEPNYVFQNPELIALQQRISIDDQQRFPVDAAEINWNHYLRQVHLAGLNNYALKGKQRRRGEPQRVGTSTSEQTA